MLHFVYIPIFYGEKMSATA